MYRPTVLAALTVLVAGCGGPSIPGTPEQAGLVKEIYRLGGDVEVDGSLPDSPVVEVDLTGTGVSDEDLARLTSFPSLRTLNLASTPVTDAGLAQLTDLPGLEVLILQNTPVTDGGLLSLARLPKLRSLDLRETQVTDAGVAGLKNGIPKLAVER